MALTLANAWQSSNSVCRTNQQYAMLKRHRLSRMSEIGDRLYAQKAFHCRHRDVDVDYSSGMCRNDYELDHLAHCKHGKGCES